MSNVGSAVSTTQMTGTVEEVNPSDENNIETATSSSSVQCESGDQQSQNIQLVPSTEPQQQNSTLANSEDSTGGDGVTQTDTVVVASSNSEITPSNSNLVTTSSSVPDESSDLSPAKKRVKLSDDESDIINDAVALQNAILEYNFLKLKSIKQR